jgi:hypothetical protein
VPSHEALVGYAIPYLHKGKAKRRRRDEVTEEVKEEGRSDRER